MTYEELLELLKSTGLTDQQIAESLRKWQDQKEYHSLVRDYYTKYPEQIMADRSNRYTQYLTDTDWDDVARAIEASGEGGQETLINLYNQGKIGGTYAKSVADNLRINNLKKDIGNARWDAFQPVLYALGAVSGLSGLTSLEALGGQGLAKALGPELTEALGGVRNLQGIKQVDQLIQAIRNSPAASALLNATSVAGGTYGLANENGLQKTQQLIDQGDFSGALRSALGDALNATAIGTGIYGLARQWPSLVSAGRNYLGNYLGNQIEVPATPSFTAGKQTNTVATPGVSAGGTQGTTRVSNGGSPNKGNPSWRTTTDRTPPPQNRITVSVGDYTPARATGISEALPFVPSWSTPPVPPTPPDTIPVTPPDTIPEGHIPPIIIDGNKVSKQYWEGSEAFRKEFDRAAKAGLNQFDFGGKRYLVKWGHNMIDVNHDSAGNPTTRSEAYRVSGPQADTAYYSLPFDASIQVNPSEGVRDWYDVRQNSRDNNKITIQTPTTFTTGRKHGGVLYKYCPQ